MRYRSVLALCLLISAGVFSSAIVLSNGARAENDPVYSVVDGRVDQNTFNGYRRYGESCLRCHGPDGAGSSYAPDLTQSLKSMSYEAFANTVINGRKNVTQTANNVMPAFGTTEDVALYLDDIYGYLKARSDDKLARGRPKRVTDDAD